MMNLVIEADQSRQQAAVVALITRTKNRPILLERALRSVLGQTFRDWIHVIVNDGGEVEPLQRLLAQHAEAYAGRLTLVSAEVSQGMEAASNAGIRQSDSEFILIHDDDDSLEPAFLEKTVTYLRKAAWPDAKGVVTLTNLVHERLEGSGVRELGRSLYRHMSGCVRIADMAAVNQFAPIAFLFRREVLDEIGYYDERLPVLGDWDFNLRFLETFDIGVLPEPLANYHQRPAGASREYGNSLFEQKERHAFYDGVIRNARLRMADAQGPVGLGLMLNLAAAGPAASSRRTLFDPLYRLPGFASAIRWLRRRGHLLRWTRDP
jgi:glycosyltransferase involved in cell wall biosynthesis